MQVNQIRQKFLDFFKLNGHEIVKSSSLIPADDPTLLFTNAGMNQFKDVFLGLDKRSYVRATSAQKCVRAGGKHNDLENVGYTARHHTFFEMLGNFSFGDYFKQDALKYAWEFLTSPTWLNLPKDKLYVTVYHTDDEAFKIWNEEIGIERERIIRIGDKANGTSDNFWQMGDTGPCGPCSEIFYDHGAEIPGGLPGTPDEDGDRYIEIWNCVFMQFNCDESGVLNPLPKPSVDTGMGLERISAVMQHVHSNYEIDIFANLINHAANITGCEDKNNPSLKVLADHIRSVSFLIADGAMPSNEGRGYVLRRIIRRAIRHGYKLGLRAPFFYKLVHELVYQMGGAYPELVNQKELIEKAIKSEEERFFETIDNGMKLLNEQLALLKVKSVPSALKHAAKSFIEDLVNVPVSEYENPNHLSGEIAFKLYDTYGFPLDLTQDVCKEHNLSVDVAGFERLMQEQRNTAKQAGQFKMDTALEYSGSETEFTGYIDVSVTTKVTALYKDGKKVEILKVKEKGIIVLEQSVFYAEGGGQVGDSGEIQIDGGAKLIFDVSDTRKIRSQVFGHIGEVKLGEVKIGDTVTATFDLHKRRATMRNHSATHLLHKALHEVLGSHATQKGSLVNSEMARFDFAHDRALTANQIEEIERIVNHVIMMNYPVNNSTMSYDEAISTGAMALFGEKYTDNVRVIKMGDFSTELCGGTHVTRTGDIGFFSIVSESGVAGGVRRIEAVTGEAALLRMQKNMAILDQLRGLLKAQSNDIVINKVTVLQEENKRAGKEIGELKSKLATSSANKMLDNIETLNNGDKLLVLKLENTDSKAMLELVDKLKDKIISGIVVIACVNDGQISLVVAVTKDLTIKYNAGKVVGYLASLIDGKGGGRADLARGGGTNIAKLGEALKSIKPFLDLK
ncbi:MAG: alanine--tRNA ligase [Burkholderiales bacterium]|jgi:alanyl-tRNA synthetase|nr:alanine--tRNA ligase [Burkholderiales bacterium]